MNPLPTQRACAISADSSALTQWLIEGLWSDQAVGILGGEPKCCKSFLALDIALSVASGAPCLRRFAVARPGPVVIFPAEDPPAVVRCRLEGICAAAQVDFQSLAVEIITAPTLHLDDPADRQRLADTLETLQPRLLILDPLIRLHRLDENDAGQIAGILSFLRGLQRRFHTAVLLVHHARKDARGARPGQALRGSSELHGWGDSNLYMRPRGDAFVLFTEHRAAAPLDPIPLKLLQNASAPSLSIVDRKSADPSPQAENSPARRIRKALAQTDQPVPLKQLRSICRMRTATLCDVLAELCEDGTVSRTDDGYRLNPAPQTSFPVSLPTDPQGNGNGKLSSSEL